MNFITRGWKKAKRSTKQFARTLRRITPTAGNIKRLGKNIEKAGQEFKGKANEIGGNWESGFKGMTKGELSPSQQAKIKANNAAMDAAALAARSASAKSASGADAEVENEDKYDPSGALRSGGRSALRIKRDKKKTTKAGTGSGLKIKRGGVNV